MSDSWSRYPNGILVGTSHQMGVYEECVKVHKPIRGKYCIPSVKIGSSTGADYTVGKTDQLHSNENAWQEVLGVSTYDIIYVIPRTLIDIIIIATRDGKSGILLYDIMLQRTLDTIPRVCPETTLKLGVIIT